MSQLPLVAVGRHTPRLVQPDILNALRGLDRIPADCPDFAHRVHLAHTLQRAGHPATPGTAVQTARDLVASWVLQ